MSNTLGAYNPVFYATEALIWLHKQLGMAGRVYRQLDADKARNPGDTITIRRPSTFVAQDAPGSAQGLSTGSVSVVLNQFKEVKFELRDDELAYTGERIITEHIAPAAYALADKIDQSLCALWADIPWYGSWTSTALVSDILAHHQVLFDNNVPMTDLHYMIDGKRQAELLALQAFSQYQGAGQLGVETQLRGTLGTRYGIEFFANQNVQSATSATVADLVGAINQGTTPTGYAAGSTSIAIDGVTSGAAFKAGDIVKVTGHTQQYVLTADVTFTTGAGTLSIAPGLESFTEDNVVVTIVLSGGSGATKKQTLLFQRNAFALGFAPLSEMGNGRGAEVYTAVDPVTGLSVRATLFYLGDSSKMVVKLDTLYGIKTLDRNLAMRGFGA